MVLFQALWLLLSPASSTLELVVSIAVVAAALLIVAAAAGVALLSFHIYVAVPVRRVLLNRTPRLRDPDAAGRPRSRAPSFCPVSA